MSLGFRLNLLITLLFALVLVIGAVFVIHNARRAVTEEIYSTANLTLQLLSVAMASDTQPGDMQSRLIEQIGELENTRHLHIALLGAGGESFTPGVNADQGTMADAPPWFTRLVAPEPLEFRRELPASAAPYTSIAIRADPADEITEAWEDAAALLGLLFLFALLANGLIFFTIGRALRPIDRVLEALDGIEQGDYRARLAHFKLPELNRISEKFNHMAQALDRARQENRRLNQRNLAIQEDERRHLARELHDELGQSISAIKAVAVSISQRGGGQRGGGQPVHDGAGSIVSICNHIYDVVRQMMSRLRPVTLDELGLTVALEQMVDDWNARHEDTFCRLTVRGPIAGLSEEINIGVYRIVQECLTNIAKHAGASDVYVHLELNSAARPGEARLMLEVRDNGIGFDGGEKRNGFGLLGIRERIEAMNGDLKLVAQSGVGVAIHVSLPVESEGAITHDNIQATDKSPAG